LSHDERQSLTELKVMSRLAGKCGDWV